MGCSGWGLVQRCCGPCLEGKKQTTPNCTSTSWSWSSKPPWRKPPRRTASHELCVELREKQEQLPKREQWEQHCQHLSSRLPLPLKFTYYTQRTSFAGKERFTLLLSPLPQPRKTHWENPLKECLQDPDPNTSPKPACTPVPLDRAGL